MAVEHNGRGAGALIGNNNDRMIGFMIFVSAGFSGLIRIVGRARFFVGYSGGFRLFNLGTFASSRGAVLQLA